MKQWMFPHLQKPREQRPMLLIHLALTQPEMGESSSADSHFQATTSEVESDLTLINDDATQVNTRDETET